MFKSQQYRAEQPLDLSELVRQTFRRIYGLN